MAGGRQAGSDPSAGLGGVDHVVELEDRRGVRGLSAGIGVCQQLIERALALGWIGDGLKLVSGAEAH